MDDFYATTVLLANGCASAIQLRWLRMPIRLIAIDIDGTLLDSQWKVPEANRIAIAEAVARGIEVALVTGRRFDFAAPIGRQLGAEVTMIVNNGALVKSIDGKTHLRNLLPAAVARTVLAATESFIDGAAVVFDRLRENQVIFEKLNLEDPSRRGYYERNKDFISFCSPLAECLTEDPIQVMYTGPVTMVRDVAATLHGLRAENQFAVAITEYEARNFALADVVHPGVSKGATLAEWAAVQGYAREEIMAIGDNLNDREMLEFAGTPVVMGNCVPALKTIGWRQTLTNDEAGVAAAIHTYALGVAPCA